MIADNNDVPVPTRAGVLKRKRPPLEETLAYFSTLLQPHMDLPAGMVRSVKPWEEIGMERRKFQRHLNHRDWKLARQVAAKYQKQRVRENTFGAYVFKHLSPEAKKIWQELQFWAEHEDAAVQIEMLMRQRGVQIRQELFIHALVSTHYDMGRALFLTGLSRETLKRWIDTDLQFAQLVEEIQWHKKNFFEAAMLDLVSQRNPLAVIWTNKTINRDRGYSEKITVEHTSKDGVLDLDTLDLDLETRRKVLEAIRKQKAVAEAKPVKQLGPVRDVSASVSRADADTGDDGADSNL